MAVRSSEDSFSWDIPAAYAFGFYGVDIGDGDDENFSLRLHFVGGMTSDIVATHSRPRADEAIIFVGLVANERFDRIEFLKMQADPHLRIPDWASTTSL